MHPYLSLAGGRRFLLCLGCGFVSSLLVCFGKISGAEYVTVVSLTVGAYVAGSSTQNILENRKNDA